MPISKTFVLVHGAGLGGWCWRSVRMELEKNGATVFTPTLTGLGERVHLCDPIPSLATHIEDVIGLIESEELNNVVLVGHSYAGMIITGVVDRIKERICRLVYLDAPIPNDGDDFASHIPNISQEDAEKRRAAFRSMSPNGKWLDPIAPELAGINKKADIDWVKRQSKPHPLRTWLDPIHLSNGGHQGVPKTYVLATNPPTAIMGYPAHGALVKKSKNWTYREISCGHAMMIIEPEQTAELLLEDVQ